MDSCGREVIVIAGLFVGLVTGAVQFLMLSYFARGITGDGISPKAMVCGIAQFILPFVVLIGCAFLLRSDLLPAGIGIVVSLFGGTAIKSIRARMKRDNTADESPGQSGAGPDEEGDV